MKRQTTLMMSLLLVLALFFGCVGITAAQDEEYIPVHTEEELTALFGQVKDYLDENGDRMTSPTLGYACIEREYDENGTSIRNGITDPRLAELAIALRRTEPGQAAEYCRRWLTYLEERSAVAAVTCSTEYGTDVPSIASADSSARLCLSLMAFIFCLPPYIIENTRNGHGSPLPYPFCIITQQKTNYNVRFRPLHVVFSLFFAAFSHM